MMHTALAPAPVPEHVAAPDELVITVALRHIQAGEQAISSSLESPRCAVFLALEEAGYDVHEVSGWGICLDYDEDGHAEYRATPALRDWIEGFDMCKEDVSPERFVLRRSAGHGAAV